jgi:hypothetical protein
MTASNLAPVLNTIYGNLGRDASSAIGGDRAWDAYRMGQFAVDPLTGYVDAATAGRVWNPINTYRGAINRDVAGLGNVLNNVIVPNVAGYDLVPGLSSRLNNVASGFMNLANFGTSMYGNIAGMGGGGMPGGAGGGAAPQAAPQIPATAGSYTGYGMSYAPQPVTYAPAVQNVVPTYTSPQFAGIGTYAVGY